MSETSIGSLVQAFIAMLPPEKRREAELLEYCMAPLARFCVWVECEAKAEQDKHCWFDADSRHIALIDAIAAGRLRLEWP